MMRLRRLPSAETHEHVCLAKSGIRTYYRCNDVSGHCYPLNNYRFVLHVSTHVASGVHYNITLEHLGVRYIILVRGEDPG